MNRISLKKISLFLLILLPFAIIIGQAPSDIIVSTISILFLLNSIIQKDWSWIKIKWIKIVFFLWIYLIFASFFALETKIAFSHSILFVRFFIFAVALQYWVLISEWCGKVFSTSLQPMSRVLWQMLIMQQLLFSVS